MLFCTLHGGGRGANELLAQDGTFGTGEGGLFGFRVLRSLALPLFLYFIFKIWNLAYYKVDCSGTLYWWHDCSVWGPPPPDEIPLLQLCMWCQPYRTVDNSPGLFLGVLVFNHWNYSGAFAIFYMRFLHFSNFELASPHELLTYIAELATCSFFLNFTLLICRHWTASAGAQIWTS